MAHQSTTGKPAGGFLLIHRRRRPPHTCRACPPLAETADFIMFEVYERSRSRLYSRIIKKGSYLTTLYKSISYLAKIDAPAMAASQGDAAKNNR